MGIGFVMIKVAGASAGWTANAWSYMGPTQSVASDANFGPLQGFMSLAKSALNG